MALASCCMRRHILARKLQLAGMALCLLVTSTNASPQGKASSDKVEAGAVLTILSAPKCPQLARMANICGEVKVTASIRKDGSVESAEATGHPVLKQAALEAVQKSTFECRGCTEAVTKQSLTFSFELKDDGDCCSAWTRPAEVTQSQDRIIIAAATSCLCDPAATRKVRSLKCLYLWRCGSR